MSQRNSCSVSFLRSFSLRGHWNRFSVRRLYDDLEASGIMEIMRECIEMRDDGSSFFVFYDKLQKIQARSLPVFIEEADCM